MTDKLPPTLDAQAVARWHAMAAHNVKSGRLHAPWLHEEVGNRMQERLGWIKRSPQAWAHWAPVNGGLHSHQKVATRYPDSSCFMADTTADSARAAIKNVAPAWWNPKRLTAAKLHAGPPGDGGVQLVWSNMLLHMVADPQSLMRQWQRALAVDGFLMFSCLGPDTLKELHGVYQHLGLGPCGHSFTDMHDWGDMLVGAGFAEPVMDMERIVLSFATPERALQELRGLGRNWHPARFAGLRGRIYQEKLHAAMRDHLCNPHENGQITFTFEVIYGHAFKPKPRIKVSSESAVSMQDMRAMLAQRPDRPDKQAAK